VGNRTDHSYEQISDRRQRGIAQESGSHLAENHRMWCPAVSKMMSPRQGADSRDALRFGAWKTGGSLPRGLPRKTVCHAVCHAEIEGARRTLKDWDGSPIP